MAYNTSTFFSLLSLMPESRAKLAIIALIITTSLIIFARIFISKSPASSNPSRAPLPPGPTPWPNIGSLLELRRNKPAFRWIFKVMKELNTDIACIRLGNIHVITVNSPDIAKEFLKKQDATFASRPVTMASEIASRGYVTTVFSPVGDQWKKMRKCIASEVINPSRVKWLLEKISEEANNLLFYINNQSNILGLSYEGGGGVGAVIDIRLASRQYTGNVTRKIMFNKRYFGEGRKDGGSSFQEEEHVDALFRVLSYVYAFCVSDYLPWLRWLDLDGHEKIIKEATNIVNKYHDPIIEERIGEWRSRDRCNDELPQDLLDVMIRLEDKDGKPLLSIEEIKAQTAELFYATIDNPANGVEWAMAEMINQPDILLKAVEEIDMVVGKDRLVQESDFPKLNYVKACIREAFRLHPVVPFTVPHMSMSDTTVAGYFIPKGSHILLTRGGLNPKVWDDPLKYIPERHLVNDIGSARVELTEPDLRFISFGTGRRGCIGVQLGSAITVMLLARLLQGFTWRVPRGEESIDLSESSNDLSLAKPLHAHAEPRLAPHLYPPC